MKKIYILLAVTTIFASCDKFLDVTPKGRVIPQTTEDFRYLLNRGYHEFPNYKSTLFLRTDNITLNESDKEDNQILNMYSWGEVPTTFDNSPYAPPYQMFYQTIFYTNEVINTGGEKMPASDEKSQILAEAHALRAYAYFGLVNMYAKHYDKTTANTDKAIPLVLKTDLEQPFPRATTEQVYDLILKDMTQAEAMMKVEKQKPNSNYAFSKVALYAFFSRVYLYMGEWEKSLEYTNKALALQSNLQDLSTLGYDIYDATTVFYYQRNSEEMIMALDRPAMGEENTAYITDDFLNYFDPTQDRKTTHFQSPDSKITDLRMVISVDPDYSADYSKECPDPRDFTCPMAHYKYRIKKQGLSRCSFRTGELYLTKAELLTRLKREDEAKATFLMLLKKRHKATATLETEIGALAGDALLQRILNDRNIELFAEGNRWFDLRRNQQKQIVHKYKDRTYTLNTNDIRYTISFPESIVKENPLLAE
ncbi:RagB/SusD family nutrient uptake outer membrane protein [Capnocytophaga felis]|uniref:Membrane protein n=1 Tax=Capnocytophaga felis TaxID=2267611 RepID=A0A5M4B7E1_9FLAO|nr:RagB/SusD family nutrient uptake outer membrane protein [Capnocytophaga felis]GET45096.1 membrane protein [Capnocytophaga felis]GET47740.1 membrane protein [Capnocytophaga felis]